MKPAGVGPWLPDKCSGLGLGLGLGSGLGQTLMGSLARTFIPQGVWSELRRG